MAKYRKKPIVVEAWQWTSGYLELDKTAPKWVMDYKFGVSHEQVRLTQNVKLRIPTLEGEMYADIGDWIIQGVKGELYPCKPDIFEATYELVEEASDGH